MHPRLAASLVLALATSPALSQAQPPATDIQQLRQDMAALRASYEARLQALEQRLQAADAAAAANTRSAAAAAVPTPSPAPSPAPVTATASPSSSANSFNPAVSLILSGQFARSRHDPASYRLRGVPLPAEAEAGPGARGFSLAETELGFAASIDPFWQGTANIALHPDDSVSVEEAYVQTTSLGRGLTLKAGRFFSGLGYLNAQHAHSWDFADAPLAYQALLGTQLGDDGVQLRWLAPSDRFVQLGLELGRGRSFPGGNQDRNGAGQVALTLHLGDDLGASSSWRAGLSWLGAKADGQILRASALDGSDLEARFDGRTRVWVADAVWKWAPEGNATRTSFKLQGEYLRSRRSGTLTLDPSGGAAAAAWRATQSGWYLQAVYQFAPAWRLGLRTERLQSGRWGEDAASAFAGQLDGLQGTHSRKHSLMLDFNASEFSRIRLQLARDGARLGDGDRQLVLQYQMSLGAHGAHAF